MDVTDAVRRAIATADGLDARMGFELLEVSPERAVGRAPVAGNTQPYGLWHGGASCVLAEALASLAAVVAAGEGGSAYGVDINATHHAPARSGWVTGVATALRVGGTLGTWEVVLRDDEGTRICTARVTCALRRAAGRAHGTAGTHVTPGTQSTAGTHVTPGTQSTAGTHDTAGTQSTAGTHVTPGTQSTAGTHDTAPNQTEA